MTHCIVKIQNNKDKKNIFKATGEKRQIMQTPFSTYKKRGTDIRKKSWFL